MPFSLIDVGASGGQQDRWSAFPKMQFVGFEPDPRASGQAETCGNQTWLNIGVAGQKAILPFYLTGAQCNSSLLKPNMSLISRLAYAPEDFEIQRILEVPCDTLDNICQTHSVAPDMLKLDTQGTELSILKGAKKILAGELLAVEIEVEFLPLYQEQALFAEVDLFMRQMGFQLMDIGNQLYVKGRRTEGVHERKGQLVSADALYFLSPESFLGRGPALEPKKLKAFLAISQAYGYLAYAVEVLSLLQSQKGSVWTPILELAKAELPKAKGPQMSERKFAKLRQFFERRIKARNANWNYGLGNPPEI